MNVKFKYYKQSFVSIYSIFISIIIFSILVITSITCLNRTEPYDFDDIFSFFLFSLPFLLSIYFISFRDVFRYFKLKKSGILYRAIVDGYSDVYLDRKDYTDRIMKLSIITENGTVPFLGKIYFAKGKYEVNNEIELYVYKNWFIVNDKKVHRSELFLSSFLFFIFFVFLLIEFSVFFLPTILNLTPYQFKILLYDNSEIRSMFNELKYEIPNDYILNEYKKDYMYSFVSKNNKHHCAITIYSYDSIKQKNLSINSCTSKNSNIDYEEKIINDEMWCYFNLESNSNLITEGYEKNNGKFYYYILLHNYEDYDERCFTDFNKLIKNVKIDHFN